MSLVYAKKENDQFQPTDLFSMNENVWMNERMYTYMSKVKKIVVIEILLFAIIYY